MKLLAYASGAALLASWGSCWAAGANAGNVPEVSCTVTIPLTCGTAVQSVGAVRAPWATKGFFLLRYKIGTEVVDLFPSGYFSRSRSARASLNANNSGGNFLGGLPPSVLNTPETSFDFSKCVCTPAPSTPAPNCPTSLDIISMYDLDGAPLCFGQQLTIAKTNQTHILFFTEPKQPVHTVLELNFENMKK
jgi:hypothetical protein